MTRRRLLLLSNSRDTDGRFLEHPRHEIRDFLGPGVRAVVFVPFAGVMTLHADYTALAAGPFGEMGYALRSADDAKDAKGMVRDAEAIVVGGGNTFQLLKRLYETGLLEAIREHVESGRPYIGWSAGAVIAGPTIRTTNDMPIVESPSLDALGAVPFQINAHYTDVHPPGHQGETRAERLAEFLEVNRESEVIGLREGAMLRIEHGVMRLAGAGAKLFRHGQETTEYQPEESMAMSKAMKTMGALAEHASSAVPR
ncbi:MAG: dipeptidase PepE [Gemmatimonadaceae bacterium]